MDACAQALRAYVDWDLHDGAARRRPGAPDLDRVDVVQPVLFAVMVSLAEVWRLHGVAPPRWSATRRARSPPRTSPVR